MLPKKKNCFHTVHLNMMQYMTARTKMTYINLICVICRSKYFHEIYYSPTKQGHSIYNFSIPIMSNNSSFLFEICISVLNYTVIETLKVNHLYCVKLVLTDINFIPEEKSTRNANHIFAGGKKPDSKGW